MANKKNFNDYLSDHASAFQEMTFPQLNLFKEYILNFKKEEQKAEEEKSEEKSTRRSGGVSSSAVDVIDQGFNEIHKDLELSNIVLTSLLESHNKTNSLLERFVADGVGGGSGGSGGNSVLTNLAEAAGGFGLLEYGKKLLGSTKTALSGALAYLGEAASGIGGAGAAGFAIGAGAGAGGAYLAANSREKLLADQRANDYNLSPENYRKHEEEIIKKSGLTPEKFKELHAKQDALTPVIDNLSIRIEALKEAIKELEKGNRNADRQKEQLKDVEKTKKDLSSEKEEIQKELNPVQNQSQQILDTSKFGNVPDGIGVDVGNRNIAQTAKPSLPFESYAPPEISLADDANKRNEAAVGALRRRISGNPTIQTDNPSLPQYGEKNKQYFLDALNKGGVSDPETRAAMAAVAEGESQFKMGSEKSYSTTSNERIRKIFGSRVAGMTDQDLNQLKSNDKDFFNKVYGSVNGNQNGDDGYNYRGRGFIQLTGRGNYEKYGKLAGVDLVNHPELLDDPATAARVSVEYMKDRTLHNRGSVYENVARGVGNPVAETEAVKQKAYARYMQNGDFAPGKEANLNDIEYKGKELKSPDEVLDHIKSMREKGLITDQQCVTLAMASVGIKKGSGQEGSNVHDWTFRKGENAYDKELPIGTPVATHLNRDGSQSSRYAGGGSGTPGAGLDHAGVIAGYRVNPKTGEKEMGIAEQWQGINRKLGVNERINWLPANGYGEHGGKNYSPIRDKYGNPLNPSENPLYGQEHPVITKQYEDAMLNMRGKSTKDNRDIQDLISLNQHQNIIDENLKNRGINDDISYLSKSAVDKSVRDDRMASSKSPSEVIHHAYKDRDDKETKKKDSDHEDTGKVAPPDHRIQKLFGGRGNSGYGGI